MVAEHGRVGRNARLVVASDDVLLLHTPLTLSTPYSRSSALSTLYSVLPYIVLRTPNYSSHFVPLGIPVVKADAIQYSGPFMALGR